MLVCSRLKDVKGTVASGPSYMKAFSQQLPLTVVDLSCRRCYVLAGVGSWKEGQVALCVQDD